MQSSPKIAMIHDQPVRESAQADSSLPTGAPLRIEVLDSVDEFSALESAWGQLLEEALLPSVFMSWEWGFHWWRHYGEHRQLRLVTARDGDRLVGILPLHFETLTTFRHFGLTLARYVGVGGDTSPDYLGPLLSAPRAVEVATALASFVLDEMPGWDVLQLSDMRDDSVFPAVFARLCEERGIGFSRKTAAAIAYIQLPRTWDDYLAGVHRDRRNTIRRTRRKVESQHAGRFVVLSEEAHCDGVLDELIQLHHKRWKGHPDGHAFSTPQYVGFHRDVIHACARRGWIRFYRLEADGAPIAVFYCYRFGNQVFYFQAGFDPDHERLRPGLVLIGLAVENAIQEGNEVFDFLRGEHTYKNQWGKTTRETKTLTAFRPRLGATMFRLRSENIPAIKAWIKKTFPFLRPTSHGHPHDGSGD